MERIKRITSLYLTLLTLSVNVSAYEIEAQPADLTSPVSYENAYVRVTQGTGEETEVIYTGPLGGYDNGRWNYVDFGEMMSCNGGHLDYIYSKADYQPKGFGHNIAVEFLVTHNIDIVYGMDGNLAYTNIFGCYIPRLARKQDEYYSWTPERRFLGKRLPNGKVAFCLNKDGGVGYWTIWQ